MSTVLHIALSKIPTNNATFLCRRGMIEITTTKRAAPLFLANEKVIIAFQRRSLAQAVQELSEITGASITIDARVGDIRAAPITATFLGEVSLRTALSQMADMVGLKVVMLEEGLYVTTPGNADVWRKEQKARQEEQLWRRQKGLPEPGEIAPPPGLSGKAAAAAGRPFRKGVPVARSAAAEVCSPLHGCPYPGSGVNPLFKQSVGGR